MKYTRRFMLPAPNLLNLGCITINFPSNLLISFLFHFPVCAIKSCTSYLICLKYIYTQKKTFHVAMIKVMKWSCFFVKMMLKNKPHGTCTAFSYINQKSWLIFKFARLLFVQRTTITASTFYICSLKSNFKLVKQNERILNAYPMPRCILHTSNKFNH